ncbi:thioredoxin-related transmembrane protein 1-like [Leptidea sinapis]|uniref:thioredoxin-related transmembrane protein 1-like n=1 Tax=Leptidea sinapis TaxID=189913 RepID=UPI00213488E7|nr:thioredoxin-related transmembrane protein 1-like [Leptidea sinapis]
MSKIIRNSDMARLARISSVVNFCLISTLLLCICTNPTSADVELNEDNWTQILEGEWMVEFYAPWCPACNALYPAWKELSNRAYGKKLAMRLAAVDVTKSPGLSGRFVVTALPTIFHVKDGIFRQYKGPRDAISMLDYVENAKWKQAEPVPSWKAPDSLQMGVVAHFFKLSQGLRSVHTMLMETYGLPTWGSYLIFAVATIFVGALLGLLLVCVIDLFYPPRRFERVLVTSDEVEKRNRNYDEKKSDDTSIFNELINDDIIDDEENIHNSDAEKNSPSDTSDEEKKDDGAGEGGKCDKPEARKRRPRKAD